MPLRLPRLVKAVAVAGLAVAPVVAVGLPARAKSVPTSSVLSREHWLRISHIASAWRTSQGARVIVAVLADGVAASQPDIKGSVIVGPDFTGSGRRPGSRYYGVTGTGLASLIVGHGHAGRQGVVGVAEAAKVLSVRVTLSPDDPLWTRGQITSRLPAAIATGVYYAVRHGASVIDLPDDPGTSAGPNLAEREAIAYAARRGVLLVAPADENARAGGAATYPGVIAVGSSGMLARYRDRQPSVALTAPGQQVTAASPTGYQTMNGTSAASAIVAGVAALVRSEFPALTPTQVTDALMDSAVVTGTGRSLAGAGGRAVNAEGAITNAKTMAPPDANLAMRGALPRLNPATPLVPSLGSSIGTDLIRDGGISFAALVVLLVPIIWYGSIARRRDRLALAAEHQWRERPRPEHPTALADPLLQYFAPQQTRPADPVPQPRPAASPRFQLLPAPTLPAPTASAITGSPPWEPAPEPTTALPWAPPPASQAQPPGAAQNAPPARQSVPPRSLFEPGPVVHPSAPTTQAHDAPDPEASAQDSGSRPIYVWKPGSTGPLGGNHDDKTDWQSLGPDPD